MERLHYETSAAMVSPSTTSFVANDRDSRRSVRRSGSRPATPYESRPANATYRGVPLTTGVARALDTYSLAGSLGSLFAFLAGAMAYRGVIEGSPFMAPLATLAIITSVTIFVGVRIRLLSVMEEACIAHGSPEHEARERARQAVRGLARGSR